MQRTLDPCVDQAVEGICPSQGPWGQHAPDLFDDGTVSGRHVVGMSAR